MLRTDSVTELSIRQIPESDFSRIEAGEQSAIEAAEQIAKAYLELLVDVSTNGQRAIADRITATGVTPSSAAAFVQSMPTQLIADAHRDWLSDSNASNLIGKFRYSPFRLPTVAKPDDDLLLVDELVEDSTFADDDDLLAASEPLSQSDLQIPTGDEGEDKSARFDPDKMLPNGGWYRDDLRLAIRYHGGGHADPVLKSAIEMISQLPISDPVRERLLKTQAISTCASCHVGAVTTTGRWKSEPLIGQRRKFTKFTHSPHLNVSRLADCVHCHEIRSADQSDRQVTSVSLVNGSDPHDFAPIKRQTCAGCHTRQAAGDACIKCHRYHIDLQ
jgi:hypothetical protein